jgi:hypothetical protein
LNADPDPDQATQINADPCGSGSGSETLTLILVSAKNMFTIILFSLAEPVNYKNKAFQMKTLAIKEGEPLPATFKVKKDAFTFIIHRDLTVTMNGTK